ncbi:spermatogenesis-associated protein 1-like isoform X2 [Mya arenaria]|uniref:spermatogenesis-associated protein 1-like isoform X2 n=1 Tax=Mya arenaria TaxID=6604 RepID=UPI0022E7A7A8|nr:spermatogenesis-associated protein 1-like isoform X2 [Mya arenaria]
MSVRMNGYSSDRERRPPSEQMADLHVYLVPPDIWRDKFNNALNQNINETVSIGFIRVHPESKVYTLRDEIEQQLGHELIPREYVFLKSVGRSLTRLKSRQENTLKVKHFLPPQAYAPELYLLEATPEVQQAIAASSEGSTRPQTRTSYDYDFQSNKRRNNHYNHISNRPQHLAGSPRRHEGADPRGADTAHEDYLPPLSATPPANADSDKAGRHHKGVSHQKPDADSGIAGFSPETYRDNEPLDRRKAEVNAANDRFRAPSPEHDDGNRTDRSHGNPENGDISEWERQQEGQRRAREADDREDDDDEERRRREHDQEKIAEQAQLMKTNSDEDMTRYPSPPPLRLSSPDRDTASAKTRRKKQKEELLRELEDAREARRAAERQREELVKQAKLMQTKTQNRRNHARDLWKKRYFDEKKKTGPLEEQSNRLRHELDIIHKRLLTTLEGPKEKATKLNDIKPGSKNSFKVQATRLQHEIEDIRRRVDHSKMKLTSEMKLRNQAETELRALRAELMQKKINLTLSRNSHLTAYAPPAADVNFMTARSGITPRS